MMKLSGEILATTALKINWKMPVSFFSCQAPQDYFTRLLSFRERFVAKSQEKKLVSRRREKFTLWLPFSATIFLGVCRLFRGVVGCLYNG